MELALRMPFLSMRSFIQDMNPFIKSLFKALFKCFFIDFK